MDLSKFTMVVGVNAEAMDTLDTVVVTARTSVKSPKLDQEQNTLINNAVAKLSVKKILYFLPYSVIKAVVELSVKKGVIE